MIVACCSIAAVAVFILVSMENPPSTNSTGKKSANVLNVNVSVHSDLAFDALIEVWYDFKL